MMYKFRHCASDNDMDAEHHGKNRSSLNYHTSHPFDRDIGQGAKLLGPESYIDYTYSVFWKYKALSCTFHSSVPRLERP